MEAQEVFRILQTEETKDKNQIKAAYRRLLAHTNPEDDPEGFKRLREAYETALALADRPAEEGEAKRDTSPLGLWLERVAEVYGSYARRTSPKEWQELLKDDLCQALDTADEAREKLLAFLMDHFRLPQEIWRILDREFFIVEQRQQLLERFPQDFINYVCFETENGGFIDFSLFDGPDDADYDEYIGLYLQTKRLTDSCTNMPGVYGEEDAENTGEEGRKGLTQSLDEAEQMLGQLGDTGIYHPFCDVERMRIARRKNQKEIVEESLEALLSQGLMNPYVVLQCAASMESLGRYQEARETYEGLLARQPDNYPASTGLMRCQMEAGEWDAAKERIMDLLDISKNDPQLLDSMHRANSHLIPRMEAHLQEEPEDWEQRIELGWCYFQEECAEECIRLLNECPLPPEHRMDYCNMLSRTYLMQKNYRRSLPLLKEWQKKMLELPDSDDPEKKKKKRRIGYTFYAIGYCYQEMGREQEALSNYDESIKYEKDEDMLLAYMMARAQLLCRMGRYEESAEACDKLLERNDQYLPAYVCREECSYRMHRGQAVVDDYYRAIEIYPAFLAPYRMAVKVFYYYRQYKNSMEVIEAARKQGLSCAELDFFEARNLRYMADSKEDLERPKELCRQVIDQIQNDDPQRELEPGEDRLEEAEVWKELVFCYMDEKNWKDAMGIVGEALRRFPGEDGLRYAKAGILKGLQNYKESEDIYRQLVKNQPDNTVIMGQLADCLEKSGKKEGLEELYKKILENDPEEIRALSRLMHIYQDRLNDDRDMRYFEPALELADRLVKLRPNAYYYIERGLLLSDVYRMEEANDDYQKAMDLEPDNLYAQNNTGVNLQHLDQYEEAERYYRRAIELLSGEDKSILPWKNLAMLYVIQGRYAEALWCMGENEKLFPGRASFYMDRAEIYERMGRYRDAIQELEKYLQEKDSRSKRAQVDIADDYAALGDMREAQRRYKKLLKKYPNDTWLERQYVTHLLGVARDYKTAYVLLQNRLASEAEDNKAMLQTLIMMVETCYHLKKQKELAGYFKRAQKILNALPQKEESYVGILSSAPSYLFSLGELYLYGGDIEKAEQYFQRMLSCHRCDFCHYNGCYEAQLGMGLVRLFQKRFEEAEAYFRRCLEINPHNKTCKYYLDNRRKW